MEQRIVKRVRGKLSLDASALTSLDHPNLVPVVEVGDDFIATGAVDATPLARAGSPEAAARIVAAVADALAYAHRHGVVHGALAPEHILVDAAGVPHLTGFGEANERGSGPYASPEHARGEGHRVDARSDVYSLGAILAEVAGSAPAELARICAKATSERAAERYASARELAADLRHWLDPAPAKHIFVSHASADKAIATQLTALVEELGVHCWIAPRDIAPGENYAESIIAGIEDCPITILLLSKASNASIHVMHEIERATSKRKKIIPIRLEDVMPDRALELHISTAQWIDLHGKDPRDVARQLVAATQHKPRAASQPTAPVATVVPKGLRSFDAHDASFFLELLPGPRDRDGLPESIRFWKQKIEEPDPSRTFAVGLLYGPSGCGKSSLVKAGLLPRLTGVTALYVEATADETESRLLAGLRKRGAPPDLSLADTLAALRSTPGHKVVIVLDQFEQWLHARKGERDTALVHALRQCDGGRVQCIVMVRDDFWLAVSRFLRELEVRLVEGDNSALVDLFDRDHAKKVLASFGRAFGKVTDDVKPARGLSTVVLGHVAGLDVSFLDQAVDGLAQDGKVISVRLALFAEMMKSRPWTAAALREVGGTEGVGVTFLEETFASKSLRHHHQAARAVLAALLPESGTDIKGHMRARDELLAASGYRDARHDFDDLVQVLDKEIRLLTPTDPQGGEQGQFYQLTHDYLVPALRDWLTRKQKETRRGRAELLLADRAGLWNARPENRQLPTLVQWASIRAFTRPTGWTEPQRKMMLRANRHYAARVAIAGAIFAVVAAAGIVVRGKVVEQQRAAEAAGIVDGLVIAETADLPPQLERIARYRPGIDALLRTHVETALDTSREHLNASLALLPDDPSQRDYLFKRMLAAYPGDLLVIRDALAPYGADLRAELWKRFDSRREDRLRAAAALAAFDPASERWAAAAPLVVGDLVHESPIGLGQWTKAFRPIKRLLTPSLAALYHDPATAASERNLATGLLADYASDDAAQLVDLMLDADDEQFMTMFDKVSKLADRAPLAAELAKPPATDERGARRQANAAVALFMLGNHDAVWPLLVASPDPRRRTTAIHLLGRFGHDVKALVERLGAEPDPSAQRALLVALGESDVTGERAAIAPKAEELYRTASDPGVHGAAAWLLRTWQLDDFTRETVARWTADETARVQRLTAIASARTPQWYVDRAGHTMVVIPGPVQFTMGSPPSEDERDQKPGREDAHPVRIPRTFAIASAPVTLAQYKQLSTTQLVDIEPKYLARDDMPVIGVSWLDAAAYCNRLSEANGIPREQWVYEEDASKQVVGLQPGYLSLAGYRLPTEAETEYATRAGTTTSRYFGESPAALDRYAWFQRNSGNVTHPVGMKIPNDLGLFDSLGNVWEWTMDVLAPYSTTLVEDREGATKIDKEVSRVLRGAAHNYEASNLRSAYRYNYPPTNRNQHYGFRVARTLAR